MTRRATRYQVTGPTAVHGHKPGEIFEATLEPANERRLLERGQLAIVITRNAGRPVRPAGATAPAQRDAKGRRRQTKDGGGK